MATLKKSMSTGKGGDAAFKVGADGSFFNAFNTIQDTFKHIEEAINESNANGRPITANKSQADGKTGSKGSDAAPNAD